VNEKGKEVSAERKVGGAFSFRFFRSQKKLTVCCDGNTKYLTILYSVFPVPFTLEK
jgi:hypothetical protein